MGGWGITCRIRNEISNHLQNLYKNFVSWLFGVCHSLVHTSRPSRLVIIEILPLPPPLTEGIEGNGSRSFVSGLVAIFHAFSTRPHPNPHLVASPLPSRLSEHPALSIQAERVAQVEAPGII